MSALEQGFGITFEVGELRHVETMGDVFEVVLSKLGDESPASAWPRFAAFVAGPLGWQADQIGPNTTLSGPRLVDTLAVWFRTLLRRKP